MKLKICDSCKTYTLEKTCKKCKKETKQAGYKFVRYNQKHSLEDNN